MRQATTKNEFDLPLKRWTIQDYHRIIQAGVLTIEDRVELLNGQIVEMVPQEPPHAANTSSFSNHLVILFAGKAWIRTQLPIAIAPNSEPEPDIAIVRLDDRSYRDRHPTPEDIFLVIEIADSTLHRDRTQKAKIYASAGIIEYWIVNVKQRQVTLLRNPQGDTYQWEKIVTANDLISPVAFPDIAINLQNILL